MARTHGDLDGPVHLPDGQVLENLWSITDVLPLCGSPGLCKDARNNFVPVIYGYFERSPFPAVSSTSIPERSQTVPSPFRR
jgi:hypothetical protein